ncbi:MAG: DUF4276 family protein, partial [Bacteroidota bacterium]|nr:DUF4276 family protein [Bacteroidota bacterium]
EIPKVLGVDPQTVAFGNIQRFNSPEEINDGLQTHPAARISKALPGYRKTLHGAIIVERIGLVQIRSRCPHFDSWLEYLESL